MPSVITREGVIEDPDLSTITEGFTESIYNEETSFSVNSWTTLDGIELSNIDINNSETRLILWGYSLSIKVENPDNSYEVYTRMTNSDGYTSWKAEQTRPDVWKDHTRMSGGTNYCNDAYFYIPYNLSDFDVLQNGNIPSGNTDFNIEYYLNTGTSSTWQDYVSASHYISIFKK